MPSTLPPVPERQPILGRDGGMSAAWVGWFREVYNRIGKAISPTIPELEENFSLSSTNLQSQIVALDSRTDALEAHFTPEGGIAIQMVNKTGAASVKGSVVSCSSTVDRGFVLQSSEFEGVGVVYESGIADGAACWVVISGCCDVLLKDGTAATRGYWVKCADTDGRADASNVSPPGGGFTNATEHFKEIGHCFESKVAGTNVLCRIVLHFN